MFKNETHNHPTEIEPFGGAATCIGGCIRDPLSGRAYVHSSSGSRPRFFSTFVPMVAMSMRVWGRFAAFSSP